jgi:hypothetical protein
VGCQKRYQCLRMYVSPIYVCVLSLLIYFSISTIKCDTVCSYIQSTYTTGEVLDQHCPFKAVLLRGQVLPTLELKLEDSCNTRSVINHYVSSTRCYNYFFWP